jgi:hypothetical protein
VQPQSEGAPQGKEIVFLEKRMAGVAPLRNAPPAEQSTGLSIAVREPEDGVREVHTVLQAWRMKSPDDCLPMLQRSLSRMPKTYGALISGRNRARLAQLFGSPAAVSRGGGGRSKSYEPAVSAPCFG